MLWLAAVATVDTQAAGVPQFDVSHFVSQIFWTLVSFSLLLVLLWRYALPRIQQILDERQQIVQEQLTQAMQTREEAENLAEHYQAQHDALREEKQRMLLQAAHEVEAMRDEKLAEIRHYHQQQKQELFAEVAWAKQQASEDVGAMAVELSMEVCKTVIQRDPPRHDIAEIVALLEQDKKNIRK